MYSDVSERRTMENYHFREITINDYQRMYALWKSFPGIGLSSADSQEAIDGFLRRNPSLSFGAEYCGELIGTLLCGHDSRRGYLYHLAVAPNHRRQKIASTLIKLALCALKKQNIGKCHVFVFEDNKEALLFWDNGWKKRNDLIIYSQDL